MTPHKFRVGALGLALAATLVWCQPVPAQDRLPNDLNPTAPRIDPADVPEPGVEVQGRGPIHEGYAQPHGNSQPGPVVPKQPPPPVPEEPTAEKPQGENVQWVPGYWGWDPERKDFLWVSGFWRNAPVNRKWVPGHWAQADNGWQWASGFWADAAQPKVEYLQQPPPASLEEGPSVPAPDDDSIWVPGNWSYRSSRYAWRPGYWAAPQAGMVWVPSDYYWTPAGCVYTSGYWDYALADRGWLYPPVYFNRPLWETPGWFYRPRFYLGWGGLLSSLWIGPRSYWFGDYYGGYRGFGFRPWYAYGGGRFYDPLFNYYRWSNRGNYAGWYGGLRNTFNGRINGTVAIPPRTINSVNLANRTTVNNVNNTQIVHSINTLRSQPNRITTASAAQLNQQRAAIKSINQVSQQRSQLERVGATAGSRTSLSLSGLPGGGRSAASANAGLSLRSGVTPSAPNGTARLNSAVTGSNSSPLTTNRLPSNSQVFRPPTNSMPRDFTSPRGQQQPRFDTPHIPTMPRTNIPSMDVPSFNGRNRVQSSFEVPRSNMPSRVPEFRAPSRPAPNFNVPSQSFPRPSSSGSGGHTYSSGAAHGSGNSHKH